MPVAFKPQGAWTALVTPFNADDQFDRDCFARLIQFQISQGISGVVPTGTTGESPSLNWDEHLAVIQTAIEIAGGKIGVLAGTGSNSTREAISASRHAAEAGASAVLLVDCYYNKPSSLELRCQYYEAILAQVPEIPIVPYIIPGRSVTALSAADLAIMHLNDPRRVPAVKQATGDLERMREDRRLAGKSLAILSGDDDLTLKMMQDPAIECSGVISVMTNVLPGAIVQMVKAQQEGNAARASAIAEKLAPLFKLVVCTVVNERALPNGDRVAVTDKFPNPVPVKTMMAALGMIPGGSREPLGLMTAPGVAACREALKQTYAKAPEYFTPHAQAFGIDVEERLNDSDVWRKLTRA